MSESEESEKPTIADASEKKSGKEASLSSKKRRSRRVKRSESALLVDSMRDEQGKVQSKRVTQVKFFLVIFGELQSKCVCVLTRLRATSLRTTTSKRRTINAGFARLLCLAFWHLLQCFS